MNKHSNIRTSVNTVTVSLQQSIIIIVLPNSIVLILFLCLDLQVEAFHVSKKCLILHFPVFIKPVGYRTMGID